MTAAAAKEAVHKQHLEKVDVKYEEIENTEMKRLQVLGDAKEPLLWQRRAEFG